MSRPSSSAEKRVVGLQEVLTLSQIQPAAAWTFARNRLLGHAKNIAEVKDWVAIAEKVRNLEHAAASQPETFNDSTTAVDDNASKASADSSSSAATDGRVPTSQATKAKAKATSLYTTSGTSHVILRPRESAAHTSGLWTDEDKRQLLVSFIEHGGEWPGVVAELKREKRALYSKLYGMFNNRVPTVKLAERYLAEMDRANPPQRASAASRAALADNAAADSYGLAATTRDWTSKQTIALLQMYIAQQSFEEIHQALPGRTQRACVSKLEYMGLTAGVTKPRSITKAKQLLAQLTGAAQQAPRSVSQAVTTRAFIDLTTVSCKLEAAEQQQPADDRLVDQALASHNIEKAVDSSPAVSSSLTKTAAGPVPAQTATTFVALPSLFTSSSAVNGERNGLNDSDRSPAHNVPNPQQMHLHWFTERMLQFMLRSAENTARKRFREHVGEQTLNASGDISEHMQKRMRTDAYTAVSQREDAYVEDHPTVWDAYAKTLSGTAGQRPTGLMLQANWHGLRGLAVNRQLEGSGLPQSVIALVRILTNNASFYQHMSQLQF